jgi:hypothetical protein
MAVDQTTYAYALKTLWDKRRVVELSYADHPFLAMVDKNEDFKGKNKVVAVRYAPTTGRSSTFATAQANKGNHAGKAFTVTRAKDYALASIDGETMDSSEGDAYALAEASDTEIESAMFAASRSLSQSLFGDGAGNIGQVSGVAANVITLINPDDVVNYEVGQKLQANPNRTGNAGTMRAGSMAVTAVDRDAGTVTCGGGTVAGLAANDYLYTQGDYDAKLKGLPAWIPATAPVGGDNFFGVDRSADPVRLAGIRFNGTAMNPDEALIKAAIRVDREGGRISHYFVNHTDWVNVEMSLATKAIIDQVVVKYEDLEFGYQAITLRGPKGPVKVIADADCPSGTAFGLELKGSAGAGWKLETLKGAPRILGNDGNKILRETAADAYEVRVGYYGQLTDNAPGHNTRVSMPQ